jgi:phenylalanyl-tRNA synthetase beta chain
MYLLLDWLKDYVEIPRGLKAEELARLLTMHTVEIDSVQKQAEKFKNVVVGRIKEVRSHPNADRLRLARVDINEKEELEIVCGADNIVPGQLVPVALVGAVLPNGLEIKEAEIRGVKSRGMLCAEDELGLGDDHSGILILEKKAKVGQNLAEYLGWNDVIFEVDNKSITHRPDLWGHYGIAREISAFLGTKFRGRDFKLPSKEKSEVIKVKVEDFRLCPRYMAAVVRNIKVERSPVWLEKRLLAVGVRPINNIVDITNYVMFSLGQPLHAFSREQVDEIVVRRSRKGEKIITLDGERRELDQEILVIADKHKPIAIAGVMGGEESEVKAGTLAIILEAANFDFLSIRRTAQKLDLRTEAAMRFEKSLDPNLAKQGLAMALELIKKVCPTAEVIGVRDEKKFKDEFEPIEFNFSWLNKFLGIEIKKARIKEILSKLGFSFNEKEERLMVIPPSWRHGRDIMTREDLAEEVARIYGYEKIKPTMPLIRMEAVKMDAGRALARQVKNILAGGVAFSEVYNYSFTGEEQLNKLGISGRLYLRLLNVVSSRETLLRQSLAPNLILNLKTNQARFEKIKIFEIGSIYLSGLTGEGDMGGESKNKLPYQEKRLGLAVAASQQEEALAEVKGALSYLLSYFNLEALYEPTENAPVWADSRAQAEVKAGGYSLGFVALLTERAGKSLGVKKEAVLSEISLPELAKAIAAVGEKKYQSLSKYPPVVRDLAFVVEERVLYNDIRKEILSFHSWISQVELFDIYRGEKLGKEKKNLAFHVIYQADRTLTAAEVDKIQAGLIKKLEEKFGARVRDF